MKTIARCIALALLPVSTVIFAQTARPACTLLGNVDLAPLLGADHEAPAPYADDGCIVKSKPAGRLVLLSVVEKPNAELKKDMAAFRKQMGTPESAKAVTVAAAPEFGPDALSTRDKVDKDAAEIHAIKGTRAVNLTLNWKGPITEPVYKQLRELTATVLAKLP